jgi:tetratricopeptide (TPR) repeat protein
LQGLSVAVLYIKKQQLHIDDFPPEISFEITEDGYLRLFAWSDEEPNKIADIQKLKAEFEQLFEKEKQSQAYFLDNATALQEAGAYDDCLHLLEQAMAQHDALKGECFIRKGNIYLLLQKYSEAVDAFMKARVLGEPKFKIAPQIREACKFLIRYAETKEERQQWTLLANDFS